LDGETGEEEHQSRGVGSGFGDGYDFCAAAGRKAPVEAVSDEAVPRVAVETDVGEVRSES